MSQKPHVTLFLIGIALSIAQFVMIRDFVTILYGEEVVIVLVTCSFFVGLSLGYALSLRLSTVRFRGLLAGAIFLHLSFPFSYRYLAAGIGALGGGGPAYLALLFLYALLFNALFAAFLPRMIALDAHGESEASRLRTYYALELAGFMAGFGVVALSWNRPSWAILLPYWGILGVVLHRTLRNRALTTAYVALAVLAVFTVASLDRHSAGLVYAHKQGLPGARVLYSVNSPYQRVEVVEDAEGERYLFLDGLLNLDAGDLDTLNYYVATVPARLVRPEHALLIGNGTLSSVPRLAPLTRRLTSVELDRGVLEAGRRFFTSEDRLRGIDGWTLHVDDGKHFLHTTEERFDLVVLDVPSPLTIQEAYLHSVEFFRLVDARLTEGGVLAVQLSGRLRRDDRTAAQVAAALRVVFPEVLAIYSPEAGRGFAYASRKLPFDGEAVREAAREFETRISLVTPEAIDAYLDKTEPLSLDHLDVVLERGWERFRGRYFR